jgi:hypothetical protein
MDLTGYERSRHLRFLSRDYQLAAAYYRTSLRHGREYEKPMRDAMVQALESYWRDRYGR